MLTPAAATKARYAIENGPSDALTRDGLIDHATTALAMLERAEGAVDARRERYRGLAAAASNRPRASAPPARADQIGTKREFEAFLRDAGWSRERAKILARGWSPAADEQRDADRDAVDRLVQAVVASADVINPHRETPK